MPNTKKPTVTLASLTSDLSLRFIQATQERDRSMAAPTLQYEVVLRNQELAVLAETLHRISGDAAWLAKAVSFNSLARSQARSGVHVVEDANR